MHDLEKLVGKTIAKVEVQDHDEDGDGTRVGEYVKITCADGNVYHFLYGGQRWRIVCIESRDKPRYCQEHGVDILIDDTQFDLKNTIQLMPK